MRRQHDINGFWLNHHLPLLFVGRNRAVCFAQRTGLFGNVNPHGTPGDTAATAHAPQGIELIHPAFGTLAGISHCRRPPGFRNQLGHLIINLKMPEIDAGDAVLLPDPGL